MLKHDLIEDTKEYKMIEQELEEKIIKQIGPNKGRGYCHLYWKTKKEILWKDYHIKWLSPATLNPRVKFD